MNLKLKDIIYTSKDGESFWKIKEGFIRGNNIKSIQFKENLIEKLEEQKEKMMNIPDVTPTSKNIVTATSRGDNRDRGRGRGRGRGTPGGRGMPHRGRGSRK